MAKDCFEDEHDDEDEDDQMEGWEVGGFAPKRPTVNALRTPNPKPGTVFHYRDAEVTVSAV
jgi:hypothetical protein